MPRKIHYLTLDPGDRFRFEPDGPLFRRARDEGKKEDARARTEILRDGRWEPAGVQEYESCFVIPIDPSTEAEEARP